MQDLSKFKLLLGSSNGIGRATALLFAEEGAKVTITGRSDEALQVNTLVDANRETYFSEYLQATKKGMQSVGAKDADILAIVGDLIDESIQKKIVEDTVSRFGGIDILVSGQQRRFVIDTLRQSCCNVLLKHSTLRIIVKGRCAQYLADFICRQELTESSQVNLKVANFEGFTQRK